MNGSFAPHPILARQLSLGPPSGRARWREPCLWSCLPAAGHVVHAPAMFMVTEADAAAIRAAFHEEGELSAIIELRQRFPGVTDHAQARACVRTIARWRPPPATLGPVVVPLRPAKRRRRNSPDC